METTKRTTQNQPLLEASCRPSVDALSSSGQF
jgi:hypothetical protein